MLGPISDLDEACLGYLFLVVPIYVVLMIAALFWRSPDVDGNRRTTSRSLRSCANLLQIAAAFAFLALKKVVVHLLPGYYSDVGYFVVWGCLLSPLPLALVVTFWLPPRFYRVASSWWWMVLYGVATGLVVFRLCNG